MYCHVLNINTNRKICLYISHGSRSGQLVGNQAVWWIVTGLHTQGLKVTTRHLNKINRGKKSPFKLLTIRYRLKESFFTLKRQKAIATVWNNVTIAQHSLINLFNKCLLSIYRTRHGDTEQNVLRWIQEKIGNRLGSQMLHSIFGY